MDFTIKRVNKQTNKKKDKDEIAVYGNSYQLAEILPNVF